MTATTRTPVSAPPLDVERAVREHYSKLAMEPPAGSCCASTAVERRYLQAIPQVILERDFGCGDPSRYVREGDTVLDLGSGGGKICFIAAQIAGPGGRVIGVDMHEDLLALARAGAPEVAARVGYANVEFHRGRIQDLRLDMDLLDSWLSEHPVCSAADLAALEEESERLRRERPLVADASVDIVLSNCVLNLVRDSDKSRLIGEIHRVVRPGGRIAISDIVSDRDVPEDLKRDPELWAGCVTGAFREDRFLEDLREAGFEEVAVDARGREPHRVVRGIVFSSVVVTGRKPAGPRAGLSRE